MVKDPEKQEPAEKPTEHSKLSSVLGYPSFPADSVSTVKTIRWAVYFLVTSWGSANSWASESDKIRTEPFKDSKVVFGVGPARLNLMDDDYLDGQGHRMPARPDFSPQGIHLQIEWLEPLRSTFFLGYGGGYSTLSEYETGTNHVLDIYQAWLLAGPGLALPFDFGLLPKIGVGAAGLGYRVVDRNHESFRDFRLSPSLRLSFSAVWKRLHVEYGLITATGLGSPRKFAWSEFTLGWRL